MATITVTDELAGECRNCDGRLCMSCVLRHIHDACADDCPDCCPPPPAAADTETFRSVTEVQRACFPSASPCPVCGRFGCAAHDPWNAEDDRDA